MVRKIGVFETMPNTNIIVVSGVEELKGANVADEYETFYDMLTLHEAQTLVFNITAKYTMENKPRTFTVNLNAKANRNALLTLAKGLPMYFTAADNNSIIGNMLGAELQLVMAKEGAVHILIEDPIIQWTISTFADKHA
ncbi:hypothetical protein MH215_10445 [Paenibacillus sp. ACRSA]|uniref:hypothetical protein n=1 Tax=Paenibacillus sp. ACRSA TaxID=2918211 RepID=UPI001EF65C37|nr:hypothetical protein [Paenibacillus sp. ACRSA]MCG7377415.1 hypothetical protein [Paenibacillus sp. ACRSA]